MKNKWGILFVGIIVVGVVLGVAYTERPTTNEATPTPTPPSQTLPSLYAPVFPVFYQDEPKNVTFSLDQTIAPFPESLPVYRGVAINTASPAATIVKTLNLSIRNATASSNRLPETTMWGNQTYTLVLSPKSFSLTLASPLVTTVSAQRMYAGESSVLLPSLVPSPYTLSTPQKTPQLPDGLVGIDGSKELARTSYNILLNNSYPVVGISGGPRLSIITDEKNRMYSLFFAPPPINPTSVRSIPLLTLFEALERLRVGMGRLAGVSVDIGQAMWEGSMDFSNVSITSVEVAYYLQEDGVTLVPVGVFYGSTTVQGTQERVIYLLYLGK